MSPNDMKGIQQKRLFVSFHEGNLRLFNPATPSAPSFDHMKQ
jgi:hypothetical protein